MQNAVQDAICHHERNLPEKYAVSYTHLAISDLPRQGILEIPLYTDSFYVYLSEDCWRKLPAVSYTHLDVYKRQS